MCCERENQKLSVKTLAALLSIMDGSMFPDLDAACIARIESLVSLV